MAENTMSAAGIQTLIDNAEAASADATLEFKMSTRSGQLSETLGAAMASLKDQFGVKNALIPPGGQGDGYAKMFSEVAEGFSSLFSELNSMRSSYLPFDLVQDVPTVTGEDFTMSEAVATQALMESYENTFFRMLGMPSTSDLNGEEPLINVEINGVFVDTTDKSAKKSKFVEARYMEKLDLRQQSIATRPGAPTSGVYNFLKASRDTVSELQSKGFEKTEELRTILGMLKSLREKDEPAALEYSLSQALQSIISDNTDPGVLKDESMLKRLMSNVEALVDLFKPSDEEFSLHNRDMNLLATLSSSLELLEPNLSNEYTITLVGTMFNNEVLGITDSSLQSLHMTENFWRYCYLLFPPVQDGRVAKCINEAKKMVAPPFSPRLSRTVNGKKLKSTLLEAVIRIRLDTNTGTLVNAPNLGETNSAAVTTGNSSKPIFYEDIANEMGLLESLIIVRLFTAVHGFAIDVKSKINTMKDAQHQTGRAPVEGKITGDNEQQEDEKVSYCQQDGYWQAGSRCQLETMKTIEDSLLLLLGDSEVPEVLDLQEGVARSSGIKSAHLMGAALSIIDVPRRWVEKQISVKNEEDKRKSKKSQDEAASKISSKLGISKGVGAIDVLAFLIAFFTAKEETLLGLLTNDQFTDLQKEFPDGFFDELDRSKTTLASATNDIAFLAYDVYQLFRYTLYNTPTNRKHEQVKEED